LGALKGMREFFIRNFPKSVNFT